MIDIKHIRRDFHSVAWVLPQGWDFRKGTGGWGPKKIIPKFNQIWCVSYLNEWDLQRHNFLGSPHPGALGRAKGSNIIKFQLQSQFQIFLNQIFVCVFSQMKDIKHIRQSPGSCFGCWESKIKFSEHSHVAYQIKKG